MKPEWCVSVLGRGPLCSARLETGLGATLRFAIYLAIFYTFW